MGSEEKMKYMKVKVNCKSCGATGLYIGLAERDGAAVICTNCRGTGYQTIEEELFSERKLRDDVERVYTDGFGFVISSKDVTTKDGSHYPFSQFGCTYEEWLQGKEPKILECCSCPHMLYNEKAKEFYAHRCDRNILLGQRFQECKLWNEKENCWDLYRREL